jgi:hypothetical protein
MRGWRRTQEKLQKLSVSGDGGDRRPLWDGCNVLGTDEQLLLFFIKQGMLNTDRSLLPCPPLRVACHRWVMRNRSKSETTRLFLRLSSFQSIAVALDCCGVCKHGILGNITSSAMRIEFVDKHHSCNQPIASNTTHRHSCFKPVVGVHQILDEEFRIQSEKYWDGIWTPPRQLHPGCPPR